MRRTRTLLRTVTTVGLLAAGLVAPPVLPQQEPGALEQRLSRAKDDVVATVGDEAITLSELEETMARRGGDLPGQYATLEQRRALLEEMIRHEMLVNRARQRGYEEDPEVLAVMRKVMVRKLLEDELDARLDAMEVTDEEVRGHFDANPALYTSPERHRTALIFLEAPGRAGPEEWAELEAEAETVRREALGLGPETVGFGSLARRHSDDPGSRYVGGVVGWVTPGRRYAWSQEVVDTIFRLDPGEVSAPIRTDRGIYLLKVVEREEGRALPFEMYEAGIRRRLLQEKRDRARERFYEELRRQTPVQIDSTLLEEAEVPERAERRPRDRPPEIPPGE